MKNFLIFVWKKHRVIGLITLLALGFAIFFLADFAAEAIYFANPDNQNRPLEPWMSIRYVEQSWGLTKPIMFELIGYDVNTHHEAVPRSVGDYLIESGLTIEDFQARVEAAANALREERGHHGK